MARRSSGQYLAWIRAALPTDSNWFNELPGTAKPKRDDLDRFFSQQAAGALGDQFIPWDTTISLVDLAVLELVRQNKTLSTHLHRPFMFRCSTSHLNRVLESMDRVISEHPVLCDYFQIPPAAKYHQIPFSPPGCTARAFALLGRRSQLTILSDTVRNSVFHNPIPP